MLFVDCQNLRIQTIGKVKAERFGDDILQLMNNVSDLYEQATSKVPPTKVKPAKSKANVIQQDEDFLDDDDDFM